MMNLVKLKRTSYKGTAFGRAAINHSYDIPDSKLFTSWAVLGRAHRTHHSLARAWLCPRIDKTKVCEV